MEAKPIASALRTLTHVKLGDYKVDFSTGVSIIDVTFPNAFYAEVGEIHFKNFYTAWLTVKVKGKESTGSGEVKWKTCVPRLTLMPNPHCEQGSEAYFTISKKQMLFELDNITAVRFILRQPSPLWKDFKIEEVKIYRESIHVPQEIGMPDWMLPNPNAGTRGYREIKGVPSITNLSQSLQQLWATTETLQSARPKTSLGRFDVDGSYDINLLSYT